MNARARRLDELRDVAHERRPAVVVAPPVITPRAGGALGTTVFGRRAAHRLLHVLAGRVGGVDQLDVEALGAA